MRYKFVRIPLKRPLPIVEKDGSIGNCVPQDVRNDIANKRLSCTSQFASLDTLFEKATKTGSNPFGDNSRREKIINDVINAVDVYTRSLASMLHEFPIFSEIYYYSWRSPMVTNQDVYFDDFRYDLQCMFYNIGATFMNISECLLCGHSQVAAHTKKECYHHLLRAAGYFLLVRNLLSDIQSRAVGDVKLPPPDDSTVSFVEFCHLISLGQAQEIGLEKALENKAIDDKMLPPKLSHQAYKLYGEAKIIAQNSIGVTTDALKEVVSLVELKVSVFKIMTYSISSVVLMDSEPSKALRLAAESEALLKTFSDSLSSSGEKVDKSLGGDENLLQICSNIVKKNCYRCATLNALVHRVKPSECIPELPPPLILAKEKQVLLPGNFPHQFIARTPSQNQ
uniref:BRO1 domain-containing protein n=1 Tax=Trypanosoma vivax (strain Y486) TaxID=1055687 RepID=G0TSP5_TRYVY|nr:conserved hypothetical protein [Trypanosoma vivax Y486]